MPAMAQELTAAYTHHAAVRLDVHDEPCGIEGCVGVGRQHEARSAGSRAHAHFFQQWSGDAPAEPEASTCRGATRGRIDEGRRWPDFRQEWPRLAAELAAA